MAVRLTILGCGSSAGVPEIGCECEVCRSPNPRNKRTRVSALVETQGRKLLIDTSPDLRAQALANGLCRIDAILYTHDHADHLHGIDDVRAFNIQAEASIPAYGDKATLASIHKRFPYIMQPKPEKIWYRPSISPVIIPDDPLEAFEAAGVSVTPILQHHAGSPSLGFRVGKIAYCTDVNHFPDESLAKLENLDVWVIDCLRYTASYTHARLEMVLDWVSQIKPRLTVLTHMAHQMDYEKLSQDLSTGIVPAYDGMVLEVD